MRGTCSKSHSEPAQGPGFQAEPRSSEMLSLTRGSRNSERELKSWPHSGTGPQLSACETAFQASVSSSVKQQ